jgi:hypothetical protein
MKTPAVVMLVVLGTAMLYGGDIIIQNVQGDVQVRQGVTEVWHQAAPGDVLKPDDTMRTGPKGKAVILVPSATPQRTPKRVALPPDVMVDMSDVRDLSQEEVMLKLAMEKIRSSSYQPSQDGLNIPNASVVHGTNKAAGTPLVENELAIGILRLNGTRVLFENGFYSTCALKAMEVFRLFPPLAERFSARLLVAEALERAHLRGDALTEYGTMLTLSGLTAEQQSLIRQRMEQLRK